MRLSRRSERDGDDEAPTGASIRRVAMDLLARREFGKAELAARLEKRFGRHALIDEVLEQLVQDGLQNDQRYVEAVVRSRRARNQGPVRIRHDLNNRGIDEGLSAATADARDPSWFALARDYRARRFGEELPTDPRERARQQRHLMQRGFTHEHIRFALSGRDE